MTATKVIEVTVRLVVEADTDVAELVSDMDYTFVHGRILETEVIDYREKE